MTNKKLAKFNTALLIKLEALSIAIQNRNGIVIETEPDHLDQVQRSSERELTITNLHRQSSELYQVRSALRRVKDGTYGTCLDCRGEISEKRLQAVPETPLCTHCKQKEEMNSPLSSLTA